MNVMLLKYRLEIGDHFVQGSLSLSEQWYTGVGLDNDLEPHLLTRFDFNPIMDK